MTDSLTSTEAFSVKAARTEYGIEESLGRRWSPRAFSAEPVEREKLLRIFEAARWAPSSSNEQPWSFVVATQEDVEGHERLASCLNERNRRWAGRAPVLMLSVARTRFVRNGNENRHAFHDVGLAVGNMLAQATAMGLQAHQMAGFDRDAAREKLGIPEGHEPVAAIALGYPGDPDDLPEELRGRESTPRERKRVREFVFSGRWETTTPLADSGFGSEGGEHRDGERLPGPERRTDPHARGERHRAIPCFFRDVLGASVYREYGGTSSVLKFQGSWLLLVTGGEPTEDKPGVTFAPPSDPGSVSHAMTMRVPDCAAAYKTLKFRGAEVRCFFRDPDGHLLEISEAR